MSMRKRQREAAEQQTLERLRGRILSGIHAGHLNPGDRLPSYRQVASETGIDLRAVARVYDRLAAEGLVEVRGRTGVYVAAQERIGGQVLAETARWAVGVLRDGWSRRVAVPDLPELLRRCVSTLPVHCTCIDSTEDQLVSVCTELRDDFGLHTTPLHLDQLTTVLASDDADCLPEAIRTADMLATTTFHGATVRRVARLLNKPLIIIRLSGDLTRVVEQYLETNDLTVICIDPAFAERVRIVFGTRNPQRIRTVLTADRMAISQLDPHEPVLASRAARRVLQHADLPPELVPATAPVISAETAAELIEAIVRLNLDATRQQTPPPPTPPDVDRVSLSV